MSRWHAEKKVVLGVQSRNPEGLGRVKLLRGPVLVFTGGWRVTIEQDQDVVLVSRVFIELGNDHPHDTSTHLHCTALCMPTFDMFSYPTGCPVA